MPVTVSVYDNEYFSGAQVGVFIGDVLVDEVVQFAYSVNENVQPVYGYASRRYDATTNGFISITGQFAINFKESGYLYLILKRYRDLWNILQGQGEIGPLVSANDNGSHDVMRATIERLCQLNGQSKPAEGRPSGSGQTFVNKEARGSQNEELTEFTHSIAGMLTKTNAWGKPFDQAAENFWETYEDMLWGSKKDGDVAGQIAYPEGGNPTYTPYRKATDPHWGPFELWVTFGDFSQGNLKNHTVQKLIGVKLLGSEIQVSPGGENVLEVYSFLAQDKL